MSPSTRTKRPLAEADPNTETKPNKAPKKPKRERSPWIIMKKGETIADIMGTGAGNASDKENEGVDHCESCGKEIDETGNKVGGKGDGEGGKGKSGAKAKPRAKAMSEAANSIGSRKPIRQSKRRETKAGGGRKDGTTTPKGKSTAKDGEPNTRNDTQTTKTAVSSQKRRKLDAKAPGPIEQGIRTALRHDSLEA